MAELARILTSLRRPGPFRRLVAALDELSVSPLSELPQNIQRAIPLAREIVDDRRWLKEHCLSFSKPTQRYPVFGKRGKYIILAQIFSPNVVMPIHDHKCWGLIGVWDGEEREERYERVDVKAEEPTTGSASLRYLGETVNTAGIVTPLIPPANDIHQIRNLTKAPAFSIHIYGSPWGLANHFSFGQKARSAVRPFAARRRIWEPDSVREATRAE